MGKAKRKIISIAHQRYVQRFKCRRQWARVMMRVMHNRDPATKYNENITKTWRQDCLYMYLFMHCVCTLIYIKYNERN